MKNRQRLQTLFLMSILFIIICIIGGCSGDHDSENSATVVMGSVSTDKPITSAKLTFYDVGGKQIFKTIAPSTGDLGLFIINVNNLPANFRVVANGGYLDGQIFPSDLSADFRGFDSKRDVVYINAVTTMVSAYINVHPDKSLLEATEAVKNFLLIPEWVDIGRELNASNEYFSHNKFVIEANNNGGINNYIDQLIAEMGVGTTHAFAGIKLPKGGGDIALWAAGQLANGAMSYAGGQVFGWGLSQLGLGSPNKTDEQLAEIKEQLNTMQTQMREMKTQLGQIKRQLDDLSNQLLGVEQRLSAEMKEVKWDVLMSQIKNYLISIESINEQLTTFIAAAKPNPTAEELKAQNTVRDLIMERIRLELLGGAGTDIQRVVHSSLYGFQGTTPMLKLWSQIVKSHRRFLTAEDSVDVKAQFDYFDTAQILLTQIIVEYYHVKASAEVKGSKTEEHYLNLAKKAVEEYFGSESSAGFRRQQRDLFSSAVPDGAFLDRDKSMMIWLPQDSYQSMTFNYWNGLTKVGTMRTDSFLGYNDWRFPTKSEMQSMFNSGPDSLVQASRTRVINPAADSVSFNSILCFEDTSTLVNNFVDPHATCVTKGAIWYKVTDGSYLNRTFPEWSCSDTGLASYVKVTMMPVKALSLSEFNKYFW